MIIRFFKFIWKLTVVSFVILLATVITPYTPLVPLNGNETTAAVASEPQEAIPSGPRPNPADYGNGKIPLEALDAIDTNAYLTPDAASAFKALRADFEAAGHTMKINSAYRSRAQQQEMIDRYGLQEEGGRAAPVGESEHGLGLSVDIQMSYEAVVWMRANAKKYGFVENAYREPWHWTYKP